MKIGYKPIFIRQYKKLPPELQEEAKQKIQLFIQDPQHPFLKTHKLKGPLKQFFSFSVNYEYRIVFEYESSEKAVLLMIGNHDIYK